MTRALILTKSYEQTTKIVKVNESCTIRLISKNNNAKQTFKKRKKLLNSLPFVNYSRQIEHL